MKISQLLKMLLTKGVAEWNGSKWIETDDEHYDTLCVKYHGLDSKPLFKVFTNGEYYEADSIEDMIHLVNNYQD